MEAVTSSMPPAGAAKSERCVSMRPDVQFPAPSSSAVMFRWPLPSTETFAVDEEADSTSPVPQSAGPPGELWPVSSIQLADDGAVPEFPVKVSCHTRFQSGGGGVPPPLPP